MRALSVTFSERSLLTVPVRPAAVSFSICLAPAAARVGQCIAVCCLAEDKCPKSASGAVRIGAGRARAARPTIRGPTKGCRADALVLRTMTPPFRSASGAGQRAHPKTGSPKRTSASSLAESLVGAPTAEGRAARAGGEGRIHGLRDKLQLTRVRANKLFRSGRSSATRSEQALGLGTARCDRKVGRQARLHISFAGPRRWVKQRQL